MRFTSSAIYLSGIILSVVILSNTTSVQAQASTPSPTPTPTLEREFFRNILRDQKAIWTAPLHLRSEDARWLVPVGVGTAALIFTDQQTGDEIAESRRPLRISQNVSYAGSGYGTASVAGAFYLFGRMKHDRRARETGILGAEALIDSAIVVTAIKTITQRTRPTGGISRSDFWDRGSSFPSGHTIQAWSLATVIASEYHDRPAIQIAAYGIASAVGIARFTGRNHYLSDVLVGGVMGFGIGRYVYHAHHRGGASGGGEEEEDFVSEHDRRWPAVAPIYDRHEHAYGVSLLWSF